MPFKQMVLLVRYNLDNTDKTLNPILIIFMQNLVKISVYVFMPFSSCGTAKTH